MNIASLSMAQRSAGEWLSSLPTIILLLLTIFLASGEVIHSQLLKIGESTWEGYFKLRTAGLVDRADRTNDTECLMRRGGTSLLALASLLLLGGAFLGALLLVGQDNLASLPPTPHSVGYEHAERLYLKGDYSTAVVELRSLAAKGDPDADYLLGYMHFTGVGVKRDVDAAITLYRSAADKGIQQAQLSLGLIYYRQPSLALGDPHGLEWVAKANKYAKTMMKQGGEVER